MESLDVVVQTVDAALVAYLVSPAAAYVSGTSVVIDGGLMTQVSLS